MFTRLLVILYAILLLGMSSAARADWINLTGAENSPTIAELYVYDDHVKVVLEVYIGDIPSFIYLLPDDMFSDADVEPPPLQERMRRFSLEDFVIATDSGEKLMAELELSEPRLRIDRRGPFSFMRNPYTGRLATQPPEDPRVIYAELRYNFRERPHELTITPPLDGRGNVENTIGFIAYHKSVPIIDFRYLGQTERLMLDWDDPWYSRFENPVLVRHHRSALMSFLYVEPYEVRHDVLTRVRDLEEWIDLGLRGDEYIEVDEWEPLKRRVAEFFMSRNPLLVDGKAVPPVLDRADYVTVSIQGIQFLTEPRRLEITAALIGVKVAYFIEGFPQEVTVDWELFTEQIQKVPSTSFDPAGPFLSYVTPDDNVHRWTNYLIDYQIPDVERVIVERPRRDIWIPIATVLCILLIVPIVILIAKKRLHTKNGWLEFGLVLVLLAAAVFLFPYTRVTVRVPSFGGPSLTNDDAAVVLHGLLRNVYRAFDFRQEEDVYDKLSVTVSGELLADIYLQNRKSLEVQRAGGAQAEVQAIEVLEVHVENNGENPKAFDFDATWTALGTVGHWGHVHARKNRYHAIVTVEPVDGAWKITGLELLEEERIDPYTQQRG
jgi:hypothetical protein